MRTIFSLRACVACVAVAVMGFTFVACGDDGSSTNFEERRDPAASCDGEDCGDCEESSSSKKAASSSSATSEDSETSSESKTNSSSSKKDEKPSSSSSADLSSSSEDERMTCEEEGEEIVILNKKREREEYKCIDGYFERIIRSSSSRSLSSSSYFDMSKQYNRNYSYGEFTDPRDGQVYKTVKHYDGAFGVDTITFFAANLNYGKMVTTSTIKHDDDIVEKICFNDDPWYCENGFGGLYSWSEAMGFPNACDTVLVGTTAECNVKIDAPTNSTLQRPYALALHQGICPEGWHIMNEHEWRTISYEFSTFGIISEIFSREDRTFTGFSMLLGGIAENNDDGGVNFHDLGEYAYFTLPEEKDDDANRIFFASKLNVDFSGRSRLKRTYVSVRCVKDYEPDLIYKDE
ncbi:MAG: hypothetical protein MJY82_10780 [Fibrobacter sp.]|nr:hypothetical protein [Fibrobacter sp.]